jgi:GTP-binding protein
MDLLPEVERKRVSEELQERLGGDAGPRVFCVSCATSEGLWDVLSYVRGQLASMQQDRIVYESEFSPEDELIRDELPFTVTRKKGEFYIEGPRIEKMLGYTNLESEKGFLFFQDFLRDNGINDELIRLGVQEGDTVHVCSYDFEYYE